MQFTLSDKIVLTVTSADEGDAVQLQILTTKSNTSKDPGKIVDRTPPATIDTNALRALGKALAAYGDAVDALRDFTYEIDVIDDDDDDGDDE